MKLHEIGEQVKDARTALGLTQAQIAKLAGLSRTTINQLVMRHRPQAIPQRESLCAMYLNLPGICISTERYGNGGLGDLGEFV